MNPMLTLVSKWGHSLAVRIPRQLAASHGIEEGTALEISSLDDGRLELRPAGPMLKDMVRRITPENRHEEVSTGAPVGREAL
ncbi:MAG: AbrB/MazE/SpoVT family DNA-binding domain-containing protein [Gammaproteobacteria bacterium]